MHLGTYQPIQAFSISWLSGRFLPSALLPPTNITPLMDKIERIVARHAGGAIPMPNNPVLGELAGSCRRSTARALNRLEVAGRINIERDGFRRRITLASGVGTAWGQSRPGHAPYSTHPKGSIVPPKERKPQSRPLAASIPAWVAPQITETRIVLTGPTPTCQYPLWADGARPNGMHCDAPSTQRSMCAEHNALCYGGWRAYEVTKHNAAWLNKGEWFRRTGMATDGRIALSRREHLNTIEERPASEAPQ